MGALKPTVLHLHVSLNIREDIGGKYSTIPETQKIMELGRIFHGAKVTDFLTREVSGLFVLIVGDGGSRTENEPGINIRSESPP